MDKQEMYVATSRSRGETTIFATPEIQGDRVLFHAVIHVQLFAEGEIIGTPRWTKDPEWGLRWPWVYPCRIDVWVPLIEQGLPSSEVVPKRAFRRIQAGGAAWVGALD